MDPDQAFGQALRSLRTRRKWSQTELALRADVDRSYISLIELGKKQPQRASDIQAMRCARPHAIRADEGRGEAHAGTGRALGPGAGAPG